MKRTWLIGAALVLSLSAVGCGDDDEGGDDVVRDGGADGSVNPPLDSGLDSGLDATVPGDAGADAGDAG